MQWWQLPTGNLIRTEGCQDGRQPLASFFPFSDLNLTMPSPALSTLHSPSLHRVVRPHGDLSQRTAGSYHHGCKLLPCLLRRQPPSTPAEPTGAARDVPSLLIILLLPAAAVPVQEVSLRGPRPQLRVRRPAPPTCRRRRNRRRRRGAGQQRLVAHRVPLAHAQDRQQ